MSKFSWIVLLNLFVVGCSNKGGLATDAAHDIVGEARHDARHDATADARHDTATDADPLRSATCRAQDKALQAALDGARGTSPNALLAVRNADCGTTVYISGDAKTATRASLWRVYSVTKTFVSASILSLVKEGKVSLDDPLSKWVQNVSGTTGVTVTMLLDHRSGIFDYIKDVSFDATKPWTPQQIVDFATKHAPYFAPDAGFQYSNTNYILLGMILEAATGQKVGAVLHARAIDLAGLKSTLFDGYDVVDPSHMARGFNPPTDVTFRDDPSAFWTCGAMVANGGDVADWMATLYDSDTVLDASQRALLSSKISQWPSAPGVTYGLGVMFQDASFWGGHPGPAIGHNGREDGFQTFANYFPDKKTVIVSITNDGSDKGNLNLQAVHRAAVTTLFP
jgi:D-alanyl-D-alanine carboxypeptidase